MLHSFGRQHEEEEGKGDEEDEEALTAAKAARCKGTRIRRRRERGRGQDEEGDEEVAAFCCTALRRRALTPLTFSCHEGDDDEESDDQCRMCGRSARHQLVHAARLVRLWFTPRTSIRSNDHCSNMAAGPRRVRGARANGGRGLASGRLRMVRRGTARDMAAAVTVRSAPGP